METTKHLPLDNSTSPAALRSKANSPWTVEEIGRELAVYIFDSALASGTLEEMNFKVEQWFNGSFNRY